MLAIQFRKEIVQEQDGFFLRRLFYEVDEYELESYEYRLVFSAGEV